MGRKYCSVDKCNSVSPSITESFHRLPKDNESDMWMEFIMKANKSDLPRDIYICSNHFKACCFKTNMETPQRRKLMPGHFPSMIDGVEFKTTTPSACFAVPEINEEVSVESNDEVNSTILSLETALRNTEDRLQKSLEELNELKIALREAKDEIKVLGKEIKFSKKRLENSKTKKRELIQDMKEEILVIKKRKPNSSVNTIDTPTVPQDSVGMITRLFHDIVKRKQSSKRMYSDVLKEFAFQLYYFSPRAYDFIRASFEKALPHPRCFSRWTNYIVTSPGFIEVSLNYIKSRNKSNSHRTYYALVFDEINIRKQILYDGEGMKGFVNYGGILAEVSISDPGTKAVEAKTALFFLACEINGNKKIPIGYILTNGLHSQTLSEVIKKCLIKMDEIDARVLTITFDGLASNFAAAEILGAKLDVKILDVQPYINHPASGARVYLIPDPCHMFKLLRNTLKASKYLIDDVGRKIEWRYLDSLLNLQNESGLRAANKLTKRHVSFENQKMKVKLCTQVLSNSVAVALDVCRKLNIPDFEGSEATSDFLKLMDRLFDTLNSRPYGKGYKAPLRNSSKRFWKPLFDKVQNYLLGLKCRGKKNQPDVPLIFTKRGTCIRGLLICIKSIVMIMEEIINDDSEDLVYLPVYKLSQDVIELFFSTIRSRFGFNNNPNVLQLEHAIKGILCMKMQLGLNGNCISQDDSCTRISPLMNIDRLRNPESTEQIESTATDDEFPDFNSMTPFVINIVAYIAGFVGRKLSNRLSCASCIRALIPVSIESIRLRSDCVLINEKNNGGLFVPSEDLIRVCKITEAEIRIQQTKGLKNINRRQISHSVGQISNNAVVFADLLTESSENHPEFTDALQEFNRFTMPCKMKLISAISEEYLKIRLHYMAKEATLNLSPETIRSNCTKAVHFAGN